MASSTTTTTTPAPLASLTFDGADYTVPAAEEWPVSALIAYEEGKIATLLRELLGADQWATFNRKTRKVSDLTALFSEIEKGLNSGN